PRRIRLRQNLSERGGSRAQVRRVEDRAIGAVEEFAAIRHPNLLRDPQALDDREVDLLHAVGAQDREAHREHPDVRRQLLRSHAIETRHVEGIVDIVRVEVEISAEIDQVAPAERGAGSEGSDQIDVPVAYEVVDPAVSVLHYRLALAE